MFRFYKFFFFIIFFGLISQANTEAEIKKTHLEDIFIWKMSDELKLSAQEEKSFTEIHKTLNKKKIEINKKILELANLLSDKSPESEIKKLRTLLQQYNQISLTEFDSVKKLLGTKKFVEYIKIKNELNSKMKSILIGEKNNEKKDATTKSLPAPKIIIEKQDN